MKTISKKANFTVAMGAVVSCPICRHVCRIKSDPEWWRENGFPVTTGCNHLMSASIPNYANEGEVEFVFDETRVA